MEKEERLKRIQEKYRDILEGYPELIHEPETLNLLLSMKEEEFAKEYAKQLIVQKAMGEDHPKEDVWEAFAYLLTKQLPKLPETYDDLLEAIRVHGPPLLADIHSVVEERYQELLELYRRALQEGKLPHPKIEPYLRVLSTFLEHLQNAPLRKDIYLHELAENYRLYIHTLRERLKGLKKELENMKK